jgi:thiol-disulfide isomerase/thioredoxin
MRVSSARLFNDVFFNNYTMRRIPLLAQLLISLTGVLWLISMFSPQMMPDDRLTSVTGAQFDLKDWRGKPVLVTFWASDCPSCLQEIPILIDLYRQYHARGLVMIAIAQYYDPPSHVMAMTEAQRLPYPVVLDLTAHHAEVFGGISLIPSTLLISPDGVVVKRTTGLLNVPETQRLIEQFLQG